MDVRWPQVSSSNQRTHPDQHDQQKAIAIFDPRQEFVNRTVKLSCPGANQVGIMAAIGGCGWRYVSERSGGRFDNCPLRCYDARQVIPTREAEAVMVDSPARL